MMNEMQNPEIKTEATSEVENLIEESLKDMLGVGIRLNKTHNDADGGTIIKTMQDAVEFQMREIKKVLNDPEKIRKHLESLESKTSKE